MTTSLKILFIAPEGLGHINACIGIAQVLQEAGHRVVFAVKEHWKGKFASYGIEEVEMGGDLDELKPAVGDSVKFMAERIREAGFLSDIPPLEKLQKRMQFQNRIVDMYIKLDKAIEPVIPVSNRMLYLWTSIYHCPPLRPQAFPMYGFGRLTLCLCLMMTGHRLIILVSELILYHKKSLL